MVKGNKMYRLCKPAIFLIGISVLAGVMLGCGGGGSSGGQASQTTEANRLPGTISLPEDTYFNEGENIVFSASTVALEDGRFDEDDLVWTSSIDGPFGSGKTLITSALSPGDHEITLSATDSDGNTYATNAILIHVEPTRFIKMGLQTTEVTDASNAFDGDLDTAATMATPDTEFIYFKAFHDGTDLFIFNIKLGASTPGSRMVIQGLSSANGSWETLSEVPLDYEATVEFKISEPISYMGDGGYISLRANWVDGNPQDEASIIEIWRADPVYAGFETTGVSEADLAFDKEPSSFASLSEPYNASSGTGSVLHFKVYVGAGFWDTFFFGLRIDDLGRFQSLIIDVEDPAAAEPSNWNPILEIENENDSGPFSVSNVQQYLTPEGYLSLRIRWLNKAANPPSNRLKVHEIWRIDPFITDPRTAYGWIQDVENSVDEDYDSYAVIHNYWGENDRFDTLNFTTYLGDTAPSPYIFSMKTAQSVSSHTSELILEGESQPEYWIELERITLDQETPETQVVELPNVRTFVSANGWLNLRMRWEDDTTGYNPLVNAYVYEIWPGEE